MRGHATEQEIEMLMFLGIMIVMITSGLLVLRVFQSRSVADDKEDRGTGFVSVRHPSHRKNLKVSAGLAEQRSRGNSRNRTMKVANRRSALVTGNLQKPWGW